MCRGGFLVRTYTGILCYRLGSEAGRLPSPLRLQSEKSTINTPLPQDNHTVKFKIEPEIKFKFKEGTLQ